MSSYSQSTQTGMAECPCDLEYYTEHLMKVPVWPAHVRILNCAEQTSPVIVLDLFVEEL